LDFLKDIDNLDHDSKLIVLKQLLEEYDKSP